MIRLSRVCELIGIFCQSGYWILLTTGRCLCLCASLQLLQSFLRWIQFRGNLGRFVHWKPECLLNNDFCSVKCIYTSFVRKFWIFPIFCTKLSFYFLADVKKLIVLEFHFWWCALEYCELEQLASRGLTLPITGLQLTAKRAVAIPVDWRVRHHFLIFQLPMVDGRCESSNLHSFRRALQVLNVANFLR